MALALEPEQRAAFLADRCGGDEELMGSLTARLSEPPETADEAGRLAGHYRILEKIGYGGLGEVLLAEDTVLGRRVALKFLTKKEDAHQQILQEARSAASLDHPFVCKVFGTGECEGKPFIAMEYLKGETLTQHMRAGRLPLHRALTIAIEIAEALAAAHDSGMVHLDVKPGNVMITSSGHVKLMDFGLARPAGRSLPPVGDETMTIASESRVPGTPAYMAPEQATGDSVDARADVFALGIVLFEMLAGVHPFRGKTSAGTAVAIVHEAPREISEYAPEANTALRRVLHRALAKKPADRYPSAREMAVDLVAVRDGGSPQPEGTAPGPIAILPFRDLSAQHDQEYFCDGLAEELIVALGRIEHLRVVSRSAAFRYRDANVGLKEIGRELHATAVLEGSVRKAADRVRIVVNLVNPEDGCPIWSERYDRTLDDIFEIQDDIARAIAEKLRVTFAVTEAAKAVRSGGAPNVRAYELYLKGRYFWNKRTEENLRLSIEQFEGALAECPDYALAHAGVADAWVTLSLYGAVRPLDALPLARNAAERALALEPKLVEAMTSRACIRAIFEWDWNVAMREFEAAIAAGERYAQARQWFAMNCLLPRGLFARARHELRTASELEPVSLVIATSLGVLDFYQGDYDAAIGLFGTVLELDEGFYLARYFRGLAYSAKKMHEQAIGELEQAFAASGSSESLSALGYARAAAGKREEALATLRRLLERAGTRYVSPVLLAQVEAGLGEFGAAASNIEEACRMRSTDLIWLSLRPAFQELCSMGSVAEILAATGIGESPSKSGSGRPTPDRVESAGGER